MILLQVYPNTDEAYTPMYTWINPEHITSISNYKAPQRTLEGSEIEMTNGQELHFYLTPAEIVALLP